MDPALAAALATLSGGALAIMLSIAAYINAKAKAVENDNDNDEEVKKS